MGMVGKSGRDRNDVAPNSPSEIVNEKTRLDIKAFLMIGRSIDRITFHGEAPNMAAP
jgi:hypothetical protein